MIASCVVCVWYLRVVCVYVCVYALPTTYTPLSLRTLKEYATITEGEGLRILRGLEQLDLVIPIETSAVASFAVDAFLFPSLRPTGELHLLPPHLEGSRIEVRAVHDE